MTFSNIVARWPGSTHDATIFDHCNLRAQYEMGMHPNTLILGMVVYQKAKMVIELHICIYVLGDSAYANRHYLLTPLLNPHTRAESLYNQSQIRTRGVVEKLFGIWKRRFPVLAYGCRLRLDTTLTVIVATAVLHNIARNLGEQNIPPDDELDENLDNLIGLGNVSPGHQGNEEDILQTRRNLITNYFENL